MKAYHIFEAYQQIYKARIPKIFELLLTKWYCWATHSRLTQMIKAARTIKIIGRVSLIGPISKLVTDFSKASIPNFKRLYPKPEDTED